MNKLITTLLLGVVSFSSMAQVEVSRPKLVLSIVVDQLRTDYIEYLQAFLSDNGFKKLIKEGTYFRDVNFDVQDLDIVNATAMLYTGNYPSETGVASAYSYSPVSNKIEAALNDPNSLGNFTTETYSPINLRLSTISDEIKIDGAGLGAVYSIAAEPQQAIIMSGHAGNSAIWLNNNNGKWSTTTYYKDFPNIISQRNYKRSLSARIDTMLWKPSLDLKLYPGIPAQKKYYPFRYTFSSSNKDVYEMFISSPLVNEEITSVAIECLQSLNLGNRGDAIDMINIGLTAAPFKYVKDGDYRLELQDTYIKLDRQLSRLFNAVDKQVGLNNTVIFLSSTGYYDDATVDDAKYAIPSGDFSIKRAISLLNSYLVAKHGNGEYVKAYNNNHIYLNHKLIESKALAVAEVTNEARVFLCKMSGVANAYTINELITPSNVEMRQLQRSIDPASSGDIVLKISPGWCIVDDTRIPIKREQVRSSMVSTPAFIFGLNVPAQTINTSVDATTLAPTLTQILRIRSPNGAIAKPMPL